MTRELVLAIDPGLRTGWVTWARDENQVLAWGEDDEYDFCARVDRWLAATGPRVTVVAEAFVITRETAKKSQQPYSLYVLGAVRYLSMKHGAEGPRLRSAADAKGFATNDKLRRLGWYRRGAGHATDAHRHLLVWAVEEGHVPARLLLAP